MILSDRGTGAAIAASALAPADRGLWAALGGGDPVHVRDDPLPGDGFWSRLLRIGRAKDSQFDALVRATAAGLALPGPVACVAGSGRGFHGLRGRPWAAEPGNLHLAVAIPLPDFPAARALSLTLLPAVAAADAIRTASGGRLVAGLKWVNDLLLDDRKVAGVITGTRLTGDRVEVCFLGIGANVAAAPEIPATPFVPAAGRLAGVDLEALLGAVLTAIAARARELLRDGPGPLLAAYREASVITGRAVRIYAEGPTDTAPPGDWPPPLAVGVVTEIRDDLTLVLAGRTAPVTKGRLAFESACREYGLPPPTA